MAKFSGTSVAPAATSPITTQSTPTTSTFEGATAYLRDARSELFLLAVTNMVGEDTFYEASSARDERYRNLIHDLATSDSAWLASFITWLRKTANMRSAPIVAAAEYIKAGGPNGRALVANTLSRADEPAEILGYWFSRYGRQIPKPLKRGVADAAVKLYNEYSALKYDGQSRAIRMGDVIELTHPKPKDNRQSHLFTWLLDRRHQGTAKADGRVLIKIKRREQLERMLPEDRRPTLRAYHKTGQGYFDEAGVTWEWLSGWLPGGMDAEAWEAVIPQMGYMALLRNLRNFDEAKISVPTRNRIIEKLADRDEVARSRQFPFRFWSAYKNTKTLHWAPALETALELSVSNIPSFSGRTLILTDTSGSMQTPISEHSSIHHYEVAALFAAALGSRAKTAGGDVDLISFATEASEIPFTPGDSVLRTMDLVRRHNGRDGMGTDVEPGLDYFNGHNRIVIFSDMQIMGGGWWGSRFSPDRLPEGIPTYIFNTGGYQASPLQTGTGHVHEIGGFSDAAFRLIPLIEAGKRADWPWEIE